MNKSNKMFSINKKNLVIYRLITYNKLGLKMKSVFMNKF